MMLDNELIFSAAQAVTSTGDTASTNVYDTGGSNGQGNIGLTGENLWINVVVNTTLTSGGSATVQAVLQDSADNSSFADVATGPAVAYSSLTAGTTLWQVQPPVGTREYIRIVYRVGTAALTAGKFDAYISNAIQKNVFRNSGFTS